VPVLYGGCDILKLKILVTIFIPVAEQEQEMIADRKGDIYSCKRKYGPVFLSDYHMKRLLGNLINKLAKSFPQARDQAEVDTTCKPKFGNIYFVPKLIHIRRQNQ
jgi:hypothetical protein